MLVILGFFWLVASERLCAFKLIAYQFVFDFSAPAAFDASAPVEGSDRTCQGRLATLGPVTCQGQLVTLGLSNSLGPTVMHLVRLHVCARIYLRSSACQV